MRGQNSEVPLYQRAKLKHEDRRTRVTGTKRLPCKAGTPVTLKEHATLPGYQIYRNDRIGCRGEGIVECLGLDKV